MEYCILIELGKTNVTFAAYTGGDGGFVPYGEPHRPLAVWFSGSSVIIGKDAKREALKGTPNAFHGLFERMKEPGHFDYANETHDFNKLVLFTLRAGMKEFFTERLLNSQGALEDNVGHLPLVMMFGADMEEDTCSVVMSQLRDNGFGNVRRAHEDDYILRSLPARYADNKAKLVLSSDGNALFGDAYMDGKNVSSFTLSKAGIDPRVAKLAELVWERTGAEYDWLEYDKELTELQRVANAFIVSGEATYDGNVMLSNGVPYHYYLSRADLYLFNRQDNSEVLQQLLSHVGTLADRHKCSVVLKGLAAANKFLQEILTPEFHALVLVDKGIMEASRALLLDECRAVGFKFGRGGATVKQTAVQRGGDIPKPTVNQPSPVKAALPTKRDERDFKMLRLGVETHMTNGNRRAAEADVSKFLNAMHAKGITAFNDEASRLLDGFAKAATQGEAKQPPLVSASIEPTGKDKRTFKMLEAMVRTLRANGNVGQIRAAVEAFRKEMHGRGITVFDKDLDGLLAVPSPQAKTVPPSSTLEPKAPKASDGETLMRSGKIKEAREWFRSQGLTAKADDCTALIRWQRVAQLYKSEISSTAQAHNREKARARAKEIDEKVTLYKRYGMDTAELLQLSADYKRIR